MSNHTRRCVETWIRCFEALARVKKLRDKRSKGEQNEITDMFLATAGCGAIQKVSTMTTEDELIMLRLIEGMHNLAFKYDLLETLQSVNLTVETCIEFVLQLESIKKKYNQQPNREAYSTNKYDIQYCGERHVREKIIAQPSVRHAPFANEKITPRRCAVTKKKLRN